MQLIQKLLVLKKNIPNVYNEVITNKNNEDIIFNISNNSKSSSILELGTHLYHHPSVYYMLIKYY